MAHGKSIELYLVNGIIDGLIIAELSNWNGKAINFPRNKVLSCEFDDIVKTEVYKDRFFVKCYSIRDR